MTERGSELICYIGKLQASLKLAKFNSIYVPYV
jgi:hypothetical protein